MRAPTFLPAPGAALSTIEKLDKLLAVDLRGTMLASWQAAEILGAAGRRRRHHQHELGSRPHAAWPGENPQLYSAVKGGVLAFSKSLARSVAPRVRVNVLAPGWIETSFGAGSDERLRRDVVESTPLKRWGTPDDVAGAAVFLASPAAAFLTGQTILVGGGVVM